MQTRRRFIKKIGAATVSACCFTSITTALTGCSSTKQITSKSESGIVRIPSSLFSENKSLFVNVPELQAPILVIKINDSEYSSLLMLCTHKGCQLNKSGPILICPCHGAEFSNQGVVLSGPAEENLLKYNTSIIDDNILIKIK